MSEKLLSVGLDVGTTSTQLIVSELEIENRASSFAVPDMEIARRTIRYKSPIHFTPLLDQSHVDGSGIREIVEAEYRAAGIRREDVDTGAVIITGETAGKKTPRRCWKRCRIMPGNLWSPQPAPTWKVSWQQRAPGR